MLGTDASPALVFAVKAVAQWLLAVPVVLTLAAIVQRKQWRTDIIEAALAGVLTIVLVKSGAALYVHARPFVTYGRMPLVPHAPDNSFPSDHLAACGLAVGYLWKRQRVFSIIVFMCAVLIGAARVAAGLHWPLDITAGFTFGVLASLAASLAVMRIEAARAKAA